MSGYGVNLQWLCWLCSNQLSVSADTEDDALEAFDDLGWSLRQGVVACPDCGSLSTRHSAGGHPTYGHRTEFRPDDSVWCFDCKGVVAVADG